MAAHYNPHGQLLRSTKNLYKYLAGGAGKRLALAHEERLGVDGNLPEHYLNYHRLWQKKPMEWIHIKPRQETFEKDEFGLVQPVQNANIPVIYPEEFHLGLWGGEGVVKGLQEPPPSKHKPNYAWPVVTYWWPRLHHTVVYSEVLGKHMEMIGTERGEWLVHKHCGLDSYLLETPVYEVYATILLKIKREILLALARKTLWPTDPVRAKELTDKYSAFALPEEEADWHGLPIGEARLKQMALERVERDRREVPRKHEYRKELVGLLKKGYLEDVDPSLLYQQEGRKDGEMTVAGALKGIKKKFSFQ